MINWFITLIILSILTPLIAAGIVKVISIFLTKYPKSINFIKEPFDLIKEQETLNNLKIKLKDLLNREKEKESKLQK